MADYAFGSNPPYELDQTRTWRRKARFTQAADSSATSALRHNGHGQTNVMEY
jgi:hypothetical protein